MSQKRRNGNGSIWQNASGSWTAQYTAPFGSKPARPSKTLTTHTQRKAQKWLTEQLRDLDTGDWICPSEMMLRDWWDQWVKVYKMKSVTEATRKTYAVAKARLPKELLEKPVSEISHSNIQEAINAIPGKRRTVEMTLTALRMCLQCAVTDKMIRSNPCTGTELPVEDAEPGEPLTKEERDFLTTMLTKSVRITSKGVPDPQDLGHPGGQGCSVSDPAHGHQAQGNESAAMGRYS